MPSFLTSPTTETVVIVYVALQLYSALIQSLPTPQEFGGIWYKSLYNFLSILGADFKSFAAKYPTLSTTSSTTTKIQSPTTTELYSTVVNTTPAVSSNSGV